METKTVAVVGSKSSGKTTTIEILIKQLTKKGYKIAAIKHISEQNFTIDTEGKDTWRFAQSGAKTIVSVASNEIATIERVNEKSIQLKDILKKCRGNDVIFLEGFRTIIGKKRSIPKIVVVKSVGEAYQAAEYFKPILAFAGTGSIGKLDLEIPYVNVLKNPEKIVDAVEALLKKG
ncbi:MAG: molybdopterin-guanine dinucleotide biosynthesis protein B [Candidatus Bathycorpusculaceae bacterium]